MTSQHARGLAAALLGAATLVACRPATGSGPAAPAPAPAPATASTASAGASTQPAAQAATHHHGEDAGVARARADSARLPWTAADARFMSSMIGHHGQAIVMARLAPARTQSPAIRTLAERITNAQRDEIATMQRWLRDRRQPVPEPDTAGTGAAAQGGHAGMHHGTNATNGAASTGTGGGHAGHGGQGEGGHAMMPGMLTPAQLQQLEAARGTDFDRLFLTYMIQHHRGATEMVSRLFGTYGAGQDETVFKFASDVNVDQKTEIARMQRMLRDLEFQRSEP